MTTLRQVAKQVLPPRLADWLRKRMRRAPSATPSDAVREPGPTEEYVIGLEARLWATGSSLHADKLVRVMRLAGRGSRVGTRASTAMARWKYSQGGPDRALELLENVHSDDPALRLELDLLRVDCQCELGQGQAALSQLSRMTRRGTTDQALLLRVGRTRALLEAPLDRGSGPAVEALNAVYRASGFKLVRRRNVSNPVGLDNLISEVPLAEPRESLPLVTVLVPIGETLGSYDGIASLLQQSWQHLEVLLIGPEAGRELVADDTILGDGRVTFVPVASGDPWSASLARASGEIVTGHAYGSWAHPQLIESQASALLADSSLRATLSSHMKVGADLSARPLGLAPRPRLVGPNPDSVMVRRSGDHSDEVVSVRHRILAAYSPASGGFTPPSDVVVVADMVPLTLTPHPADMAAQVGISG